MSFHKFRKQYLSKENVSKPEDILRVVNALQGNIEDAIQPLIVKIQNDSLVLQNISLKTGQTNIINHLLGRRLLGWEISRQRSKAQIWDNQDNNLSPQLTLFLDVSNDVIVDLVVF